MSKNSQPSVSIPQYSNPTPTDFNTNYGSLKYANGAYNYTSANPESDAEMATLRDAIGAHLGVTGSDQLAQNQDWQTAFQNAALKNSAPQLSNQLFNAGLGGSTAYSNALGDLYSNVATQGVLNGQSLNLANTQSMQNSFNTLNSGIGQGQNYALNLANVAAGYNTNANAQANQRYQATLPYLATVNNNQGQGYGQLIGAGLGAVGGAFIGNPILGAQLGSTIGGGVDTGMGNQSVGGNYINAGLSGFGALNGAGFFSPSPLQTGGAGFSNTAPMGYNPANAAAAARAPQGFSIFNKG